MYIWDDTIAAISKDFSGVQKQVAQETIGYTFVIRSWRCGR